MTTAPFRHSHSIRQWGFDNAATICRVFLVVVAKHISHIFFFVLIENPISLEIGWHPSSKELQRCPWQQNKDGNKRRKESVSLTAVQVRWVITSHVQFDACKRLSKFSVSHWRIQDIHRCHNAAISKSIACLGVAACTHPMPPLKKAFSWWLKYKEKT